ncbi:MAG: type III pantothenate kinase [Bacteroidales bacterium]|nr:type III pantothenate kinase [Bacteroidales bacterium]
MNLIIDIGNTKQKLALVNNNNIVSIISAPKIKEEVLKKMFSDYKIEKAIISNVRKEEQISTLLEIVSQHTKMVKFQDLRNFPIINKYQTPDSLGTDRLAVSAGSQIYAKGNNVLVIQIGTCITYEFIDKNAIYHGGAISPGTLMRFKSLHHHTGNLPLVKYQEISEITGKNTEESILSGVLFGIVSEIDGNIEKYKNKYPDLRIIMTGGGAKYFDKLLKNEIFAVPNLVIIGLNYLLEIHEE